MKKALITGIRGQDGAYLAKLLLEQGYQVYGADRRSSDSSYWRLEKLKIKDKVKIIYMDLLEESNVYEVMRTYKFDEIYNLAAQSFVQVSFNQPLLTANVNSMGTLRILEAIRLFSRDTKFYQASTSELYGKVQEIPQRETTPFYPRSPYAVSKLFAHWITVNYREAYGMFNVCGILFNHESPLRSIEFITKKVVNGVCKIKLGLVDKIEVGNIEAKRDWGYAPEYVYGMYLMMNHPNPDDFVLATGEIHSVKELIEKAFSLVDIYISWQDKDGKIIGVDQQGKIRVQTNQEYYRPSEVDILVGDYSKAKQILGWEPKVKFDKLIEIMVEEEMKELKEKK
ncbi:MAG: GDP-mannose 4,6-dehydratase [Candidatus Calescibacterium sp.]|nr:GDP-mannose 4,6-dehydratase [Candidatus Calescibacterium sp.]MCX7972466.1 GDP-mannose 4,6-dehydratase [bacterium]MDW8195642.1 GDP-mannose 4,6-dehydratase [Candidatus Calescibacterium sp.]